MKPAATIAVMTVLLCVFGEPALANVPPIRETTKVFQNGVSPSGSYAGSYGASIISDWDPNYTYVGGLWAGSESATSRRHRGLLFFDLSSLGSGLSVNQARLVLYCYSKASGDRYVKVHEVTTAWGKPVGTSDHAAGTGEPCWNWAKRDVLDWQTDGGDFVRPPADSALATQANATVELDVTGIVGGWLSGSVQNNGFILTGEEGIAGTINRFRTPAHTAAEQRPELEVVLTPSNLPDLVLTTESSYDSVFTLGDYMSDPDGDLLSFSVAGDDSFTVTIDPVTSVVGVVTGTWYGLDPEVIFTADDGNGGTVSDTIQVTVRRMSAPIPNQRWAQGSAYPDAFDLDDYFANVGDTTLVYKALEEGHSSIVVTIDPVTHSVSFSQPPDFYGSEWVMFSGSDKSDSTRMAISNKVFLTVDKPDYADILSGHPRILITEQNRSQLLAKVTDPTSTLKSTYDSFINNMAGQGKNKDLCDLSWGSISAVMLWTYALGYAYQMTGDTSYAATVVTAMECADKYAAGAADYDRNAQALEVRAIGFDWCYDYIVEHGLRDHFADMIAAGAGAAINEFESYKLSDFHNYALGFETALLFAGLALYGEDSTAAAVLDYATGLVEGGKELFGTTYSLKRSIEATGGACNWEEGGTYTNVNVRKILKMIDGWDTARGNRADDLWHGSFGSLSVLGRSLISVINGSRMIRGGRQGDASFPQASWSDFNNLACTQNAYKDPYVTDFVIKEFPSIPKDQYLRGQVFYLLWFDPYVSASDYSQLPMGSRFGSEFTMRSGWSDDDIYVHYRGGIHWGNHNHLDHTSFTIFRGDDELAIDSGFYDSWSPGTHHWTYYKRTVAHNTITVFDSTEVWTWRAQASVPLNNDGGQRFIYDRYDPPHSTGGSNEILSWNDYLARKEEFTMAETKAYEAVDSFLYIYQDATNAYTNIYSGQGNNQNRRVKEFARRFLYFRPGWVVVFDRVNAYQSWFRKDWLLHSIDAPQIRLSGNWVTPPTGITEYDSKEFRINKGGSSLFGETFLPDSSKVRAIGGSGYEYWVNGQNQSTASYPPADPARLYEIPGAWRIEVEPMVQDTLDLFLHVLYVADSTADSMPPASMISLPSMVGVETEDFVALFSRDGEEVTGASYAVSSSGTVKHMLADMTFGTYEVRRNGTLLASLSPDTASILTFEVSQQAGDQFSVSLTGANQPPPVPEPVQPAQGSVVDTLLPRLCVAGVVDPDGGPGSLSYVFELSGVWSVLGAGLDTVCVVVPLELEDGGEYYWRVSAFDGADSSGWSSGWSFGVALQENEVPPVPGLLSPLSGTYVDTLLPRLCVAGVVDPDGGPGVLSYVFELSGGVECFGGWFGHGVCSGAVGVGGWWGVLLAGECV